MKDVQIKLGWKSAFYQLPVAWLLSTQPLAQSYCLDVVVSLAPDGSGHDILRSKEEPNYKHADKEAKQYTNDADWNFSQRKHWYLIACVETQVVSTQVQKLPQLRLLAEVTWSS